MPCSSTSRTLPCSSPPSCTTWISSKLCVGRAPTQHQPLAASFLSEQRIEKARNLLLNTALPLAEIGLPCGFGDQSHCTRVFTRLGGVGPGQWRRLYRVPPAPPVDDR